VRALRRQLARISNFTARRRGDGRLWEEMEEHIALLTAENLRAGMPPETARREAVLKFGAVQAVREDYHDEHGLPLIENLLQDLRYAIRLLAKSPGFTAIAVLTMALGIGATTAIFSVVDATLLHPLSYPHSEQLVRLEDDLAGAGALDVGMSVPEWKDLQRSGIFQYVSPLAGGSVNVTGSSRPARILFAAVAPNYLAMLGVKPELGRWFDPNDPTPGFNLDVVISDGLWKRSFGADPRILGRTLRLDNDVYRIVGVMPPGFHDPGRTRDQRNNELWAAVGFSGPPLPAPIRKARFFPDNVARLKPGLTLASAQSRVDALVASLQHEYPSDYPRQSAWRIHLIPLKESVVGDVRQSLITLLIAVGLVLLIGCANVANLLLARASARAREMAVRQALGAGRKRLVRQLLTESLLLSLLGGIAGLAILVLTRGFLLQLVPDTLPRLTDVSLSGDVLLFALAASVLCGLIFGLAPALQTGRLDLAHTLKLEGRGSKGSAQQAKTRRLLVVSEFALSLVLMIAAGLLLRSFSDLYNIHLGFNPHRVTTVQTWLPVPNDPSTDIYGTPAKAAPLFRELLRRNRSLPGVEEAALGSTAALPLDHVRNVSPLILEGRPTPEKDPPLVERSNVTPGYFHLIGIPLLRGRLFTDADDDETPSVVVINETMARTWWPHEDPIGKRLNVDSSRPGWAAVIGIVADAQTESLTDAAVPELYESLYQRPAKDLVVFLRGPLDAGAITEEVRAQVQSVNSELPVFDAETLDDALSTWLSQRRFLMEMVALFALTALLLAGLGIYGTISYVVSERTQEFGVRLALGAGKGAILQMVLRQGLGLAAAGTAVGLIASLIAARLMTGLLYGVRPTDPLTFVGVTLVLTGVAVAACLIPARRAMRVDPVVALRYE